jgi:peptide deformylase
MRETLEDIGGIGLAAPQVNESVQLAIIGFSEDNDRYRENEEQAAPIQIIINPIMTVLDNEMQDFWEGCLSIPGLRGVVSRPRKIQLDFLDETGAKQQLILEDFIATVYQHELDHLLGRLYIDHIKDTRLLCYEEEYLEYHVPKEEDEE